jgi:glucosamine--fructose-6-phosphate aminotransferase (isomerizing)
METEYEFLRDVLDQPRALRETLRGLPDQSTALRDLAHRLAGGDFRQVVLTGMGSSFYALHPLALRLVERGLAVQLVETSELIHYMPALLNPANLIVVVSQSGRSAETVRLLEQAGKGVTLVGVTNTADGPLAVQAQIPLLTRAGDEAAVACKTYSVTLLALAWLGDVFCSADLSRSQADLGQAAQAAEQYLAHWQAHVEELRQTLTGVRQMFLVGRGPSLAAVGNGALTTKEAVHLHAEGLSSAAFRHGPLEIVSAETLALVFAGLPATAELNRRLAADVVSAGGRAALVTEEPTPGPFHLPPTSAAGLPILETLPTQLVILALAALQGQIAGRFSHATKVTTRE